MHAINGMNEGELRRLVSELVPALGEARVTAAHSKLQHSLLSIQTEESIKRAEVEHEATRREVQVLQEGSPAPPHVFSPVDSPQTSVQRNLRLTLSHCTELQSENAVLKKRVKSSKKLISQLDGENTELKEQVGFLRQRIKDNRDHITELQDAGVISLNGTPHHEFPTPHFRETPRTPATSRTLKDIEGQTPGAQNFFALLQVANLDKDSTSVASSPSQKAPRRLYHHMRGAHSMSSLPVTPERRPVTSEGTFSKPTDRFGIPSAPLSAPGMQLAYDQPARQDDRQSTISISDNEDDDVNRKDELTGSQASQMASSILRRNLEAQNKQPSPTKQTTSQSKTMQAKIYGNIQKPRGPTTVNPLKRKAPHDGSGSPTKGSAVGKAGNPGLERIGLGIRS